MAILTYLGRSALLQYLVACPIFLAIGEGVSSWGDVPDPPDYEATGLINVFGYKKLTRAFFVNEDDDGNIDMPGGKKYQQSDNPTRELYMHFAFPYGEGTTEKLVREVGVFINTRTKSGLPAKQTYFTPDEIADKGTLIILDHINAEDANKFSPRHKGAYETILTL